MDKNEIKNKFESVHLPINCYLWRFRVGCSSLFMVIRELLKVLHASSQKNCSRLLSALQKRSPQCLSSMLKKKYILSVWISFQKNVRVFSLPNKIKILSVWICLKKISPHFMFLLSYLYGSPPMGKFSFWNVFLTLKEIPLSKLPMALSISIDLIK